jgi:hypothetical protein
MPKKGRKKKPTAAEELLASVPRRSTRNTPGDSGSDGEEDVTPEATPRTTPVARRAPRATPVPIIRHPSAPGTPPSAIHESLPRSAPASPVLDEPGATPVGRPGSSNDIYPGGVRPVSPVIDEIFDDDEPEAAPVRLPIR